MSAANASTADRPPVPPSDAPSGEAPAGAASTVHSPAALSAAVSRELALRWPAQATDELVAVHSYALNPPGKLFRPLLLLNSALAVGGTLERVLPAAVGIECAHVGSLIHDDLIDGDDTRRERRSVPHRFGPQAAIVAGDALFFVWFSALAECIGRGVAAELAGGAMAAQASAGFDTCRGASMELTMSGALDWPMDDYLEMARLKTGALMSTACRVGAVLAGASEEQLRHLGRYGELLGTAFQIENDLVPWLREPGAGAPAAASDVRNKRPALPVLLAHARADQAQRAALTRAWTEERDTGAACARVYDVVRATRAVEAVRQLQGQHLAAARAELTALPASAYRQRLIAAAWLR